MSRSLEEILARAGETGCDWMLTAEEAGLLRREVERLRDAIASLLVREAKAVREEREAVVRWLRANENTYWANRNYGGAADNIERGEHRK